MITKQLHQFLKGQSPLRERRNDFKVKLAVEESQKTTAAAAHYDEPYNVLSSAFREIQREIELGLRERERERSGYM